MNEEDHKNLVQELAQELAQKSCAHKGPKSGLDAFLGALGLSSGDSGEPQYAQTTEIISPPQNASPGISLPQAESAESESEPPLPEESDDESSILPQDPSGPPGQYYEGQFKDAMKHGQGLLHYHVPGRGLLIYEGEFRQNQKHGYGVLKWPSGQQYQGQFLNDDFHGEGDMVWPDGNQYVGEYANGKKHGVGTCFFADGSKYYGQFCEGKRHGEITRVKADNTTQVLHFSMGSLKQAQRLDHSNGEQTHRSLVSETSTEVTSSGRSSTSKSTSASSVSSLSTSSRSKYFATLKNLFRPRARSIVLQHPQKWRVVDWGAVVRATDSLKSKKLGTLRKNEELTIVEVKGRRMRVVSPLEGWVTSIREDGINIMMKIDEDEDKEH